MSDKTEIAKARRNFLKLVGGGAVLIPLAGLQGCGGGEEPTTSAAPKSEPPPPAAKPAPATAPKAAADPASLPKLAEDDPQAVALGYQHDAKRVDKGKYTRFEDGQLCSNCALFQAKGDEEWAVCSLFPGKTVNANGWCNAYAPKS